MPAPDHGERYANVVWELTGRYEWLPLMVVARVVRRAAVTLAVVSASPPSNEAVLTEAAERLNRATAALLAAANDAGVRLQSSSAPPDSAVG